MPSLLPGYSYDIFISYRHNDNLDGTSAGSGQGWVTEFVEALERELKATLKEPLSIYFDKNPHDGLLETHHVDKSLEGKLKCLIFIPILSQTYCDARSFAWQHEFCAFNKLAQADALGRDIKLGSGNVASRILPVMIHDLDAEDKSVLEKEIGGALRAIEFIYKSPGVNRPLRVVEDHAAENQRKTIYRDQVNKMANAIKEIVSALKHPVSTKPETPTAGVAPRPQRKTWVAAVAVLVLISIGYLAYRQFTKVETSSGGKSIAVLPFVNMSNDPDQEYFSDGITEEILNTLVKINDLKVAGRTSSFQYKGKNEDLKKIGADLGVTYLMEGSVRKTADEVRITAQLINAETGFHLWSNEYTGPLNDVFKLQEQVSLDIARTLRDKLGVSELSNLKNKTVNAEAYDYFLKGRQLFLRREKHDEMQQFFRRAIEADSTFDQAYSGLAGSYVLYGIAITLDQIHANLDQAIVYASKALQLDSSNAEAYAVLGIVSDHRKEWIAGRRYLEKAIALNPGNSTTNLWFGQHHYRVGHFAEATHYVEKAISIEPFYAINYQWMANIAILRGDMETCVAQARKATMVSDDGWGAGILMGAYLETHQLDKLGEIKTKDQWAINWMDALVKKDTLRLQSMLGAHRELASFEYVWIGDLDGAMRIVLKYGEVWETLGKYRSKLRRMPGFRQAILQYNLDDYWKLYGGPDICPDIMKNDLVCE